MGKRFVFVPIFGDTSGDHQGHWLKAPHVKAWGFMNEDNQFTPIHTDPALTALPLNQRTILFDNERDCAVDIPEDSTDLPEAVCVALARMALIPDELGGTN